MNAHRIASTLQLIKSVAVLVFLLLVTRLMTILVFCVGVLWIYDGIARGMTYSPLVGQSPICMTVVKLENRNHRRLIPDYVATVSVSNEASTVDIPIFEDQFRRLRPGSTLETYPLPSGGWLNRAKLDESMPIFGFLGLHYSWHFPAGVLMLGGWFGLVPYLRRKEKRNAGPCVRPHDDART